MKILIVSRKKSIQSPFVTEQANALTEKKVTIENFYIEGKGLKSYLRGFTKYKLQIKLFKPDIIHAHYGLSGLFANLQRSIPVITTFHGTDINSIKTRLFSLLAIKLSRHNIFVSDKIAKIARVKSKYNILPCGVDLSVFYPMDRNRARTRLNLAPKGKYVLFSGAFDNPYKNVELAQKAINKTGQEIDLLELKNYTREEVNLLLNACNVALLTSPREGSPQFIKEAMACNIPIVSTDVGDVKSLLNDTPGCYISSFNSEDIAEKITNAFKFQDQKAKITSREKITGLHLDNESIIDSLLGIYHVILR